MPRTFGTFGCVMAVLLTTAAVHGYDTRRMSGWERAYFARSHWAQDPSKYAPSSYPDDEPGAIGSNHTA